MENLSFKQFLQEAPINDYKTFGNWDKGSSFTDKRDRTIIQHPRAIEIAKKRFSTNNYDFNLYFLNSKEARNFTEVGEVDEEWVENNLGENGKKIIEELHNNNFRDCINIIFTNNKGDERMAMTSWIMAHRIMHALARPKNNSYYYYKYAMNELFQCFSEMMEYYGITDAPKSVEKFTGTRYTDWNYGASRNQYLKNRRYFMEFFRVICTFKSARDNNVREYFEILNELGAQLITTGNIRFNKVPETFGNNARGTHATYLRFRDKDKLKEANEVLRNHKDNIKYAIDSLLGAAIGSIYVM